MDLDPQLVRSIWMSSIGFITIVVGIGVAVVMNDDDPEYYSNRQGWDILTPVFPHVIWAIGLCLFITGFVIGPPGSCAQ